VHARFFAAEDKRQWFDAMVESLVRSGALRLEGDVLHAA